MSLFGSFKLDTVALIAVLITLIYFYLRRTYSYWERRGFKTLPNAHLIFGHSKDVFTQKESLGHFFTRIYRYMNEPFVGVYGILRPMLLINDPELIQKILIKDFQHFVDHGVYSNEKSDVLSAHLFALKGQKWRNVRNKLSPAFTSGKLKAMFSTLLDCGSTLQNYLENSVVKGEILDVREITARHSTNVIASVGFGMDIDTISYPKHEFREMMNRVFVSNFWNGIRYYLRFLAPQLMYALGIRYIDKEVEDYLISIVRENIEAREKGNIIRKDVFQLLMQLRHGQSIESDDQWQIGSGSPNKSKTTQNALTINEMSAQAFIFITAGFETSATTVSYCLYEMARNQEIQQRIQKEIDEVLEEHDGQITFDSVSKMNYLNNCVKETLRKYPVQPYLNRRCVKDYQIPGTDQVIEKGVDVFISLLGLQRDEKYYEKPNKFDPDRWNEKNEKKVGTPKPPYLPFGDGPRTCVAARLGLMQVQVALVLMLQKFKYDLHGNHENESEIEFDPRHFLLQPSSSIYLHVSKR